MWARIPNVNGTSYGIYDMLFGKKLSRFTTIERDKFQQGKAILQLLCQAGRVVLVFLYHHLPFWCVMWMYVYVWPSLSGDWLPTTCCARSCDSTVPRAVTTEQKQHHHILLYVYTNFCIWYKDRQMTKSLMRSAQKKQKGPAKKTTHMDSTTRVRFMI